MGNLEVWGEMYGRGVQFTLGLMGKGLGLCSVGTLELAVRGIGNRVTGYGLRVLG
jgi:hypothetical protein